MCFGQAKPPAVLCPARSKGNFAKARFDCKEQGVCWTSTAVGSLGCRQDICCVSSQDICCVSSKEGCNSCNIRHLNGIDNTLGGGQCLTCQAMPDIPDMS